MFLSAIAGLLLALASPLARAQSASADVYQPGGIQASATVPSTSKGGAARITVAPVARARTSQILLNSYADTPLAVALFATDADAGSSILSYTITALPPTASGILKLRGTAVTTNQVIVPADAGSLTFDPAAGYFGTAVFSFTAKDNTNLNSAVATYGIPVAKATCGAGVGQANVLSYYARTEGEDWKVTRSVVVDGVTITANPAGTPYTASPTTTDLFFVSDQPAMPGKGLVWAEDYTTLSGVVTTSTFTFSRPLANLTLSIGDIDNGTGYTDFLSLQGYDANNTLVNIPTANVTTGNTNSYANNTFTGTANSPASANTNALVTFPSAITRLVMTYRNTATTQADPSSQLIVFPSIAWCAQADVQTTLTGPTRARAGSTVTYTATTTNGGTDAVNSIAPQVQLPTGLTNVTGGTYNSSTGVLTLATISNLASGASVANTITYTMPATVAVTATSSFVSTADDLVSGNNTATLTTAQNRAPVASDVTSSPAILSSTATQTNIASFNASDPDATTGNTTITSFTIMSLPTAAQGTLYVNGVAATVGQVITVPASATPGNPGYQLSFIPNGTFSGNASFTYKATDDTGTGSNTANYFVPVTAGADLASVVTGSGVGVEGQTKTYGVTTTNNGPATATNVVQTLTLSSKPPFSSVTVTNGTYDPSTGIITFNTLASLASGSSVFNTVAIVVQPTPTSFTITAANTSATADPTPANNNGTAPAATLTVTVSPVGPAGIASACATPGRDGSPVITSNPNTYYPAADQTLVAGATSVVVGAATGTALTAIAAGDLLLVIQMQGADIDATNTDAYGDGVAGGSATNNLNNANFTAGKYEYVTAANGVPVGGGSLTIANAGGLKNGYQNASATSTTGQRRFQVVRIPQYQNLTVGATVTPSAWDGRTGGILALDVVGKISFAQGTKLDASGMGFRGGAGQKLTGAPSGYTGTDYRAAAPASAGAVLGAHAMKGEGIAGTPRYVSNGTALVDTGVDGYPNGSSGRGGAGNAGGGGTDANPTANDQNSGGGGGGNGSRGGRGGNSSSSNTAVGGEFGGGFNAPSSSRLVMGGGGGAGVTNDGTGDASLTGYASSGAAGGGIVLLRAGSVAGLGSLLANGASASNAVTNDGSGGGGAGGSILFTANNTASAGILNLAANGGTGGTNTGGGAAHGPGGGGGGGVILSNATTNTATVASGANGTTAGNIAYGATAGSPGLANNQISNSIANSTAGINCSTDVVATATATATTTSGSTVNASVTFANNGGVDAANVTRSVVLSSGSALAVVTGVSAPGSTSISAPDPSTGNVTVTYPGLATLAAGGSNSFGLSYTVPGVSSVTITAVVGTTTAQPVTGNDTGTATTTVTGFADIVAVVFGLNASAAGQTTATYGALFANNGPASASNVTRTVTLPAGASLTQTQLNNLTAQGATYNNSTQVIDFGTVGTLVSRDVSVYRYSYVAPNASGSTTIVARTTTTTPEDASGGTGAATAPDTFPFTVTNNPAADEAVNGISALVASATPNQQVSFTVNFTNNGPSDSPNAQRYALLTPGLNIVSITDGGVYDAVSGVVTYPTTSIPNGSSAPSTITFLAPAIGPVNISGSLSTGAGTVSPGIFANNQATTSMNITPIADVATTISGPGTAVPGNLATFAVTTANNGPSPASAVVQTIQLPTGLTGVFPSNKGTYNSSTGVVTFPTINVLTSGLPVNNTVSFHMPASGFTATALVSSATGQAAGTAANDAATAAPTAAGTVTTDKANVYNLLNFSSKNVAPGAPLTFTIETGNNGPNPALNVVQQLSLPLGLTVTSISGGGSYNSATGLVTFPALASLASGSSVTNTVTVNAPVAGPLVPMASVASGTSDPVPADNEVIRNVDVIAETDVVTQLVGPGVASATQITNFTVTTLNRGPLPATNVVQTVAIASGLPSLDVTTSGGGVYDPATGVITWPTVATLGVGAVRTYSYTYVAPAFVSTDANAPRTLISQASVTSSSTDPTKANNAASIATEIKWNSDVAIAISAPASAVVGNPVTFTASYINNGPAPAGNVSPLIRIATGLNVVASDGGVYDITTGIVTFPTIANMAVGVSGSMSYTMVVTAPDRPLIGISVAANVPTSTNDVNLTNNAETLILPLALPTTTQVDLQTNITANVSSQSAGQPVVFTVTATNAGTDASDLRERVTLVAGLGNVVVSDGFGNLLPSAYSTTTGVVTFPQVTALAGGTTLTYTITVNDPVRDPIRATATVNGNFTDPNIANNTKVLSVNIVPVADVATLLYGPTALLPGALAEYQVLTVNSGPSPANSVVQTVQLPTGLTDVVLTGGGSYNAASGQVTFPIIALQAVGKYGEVSNTIRFTFPTTTSSLGATVSSATMESAATTANNTASLTTTLTNQAPLANTVSNRLQSPEGNTAAPLTLSALSGFDPDGSLASYTITALPAAAAGTLLLNGSPVAMGQVIGLGNAANLKFDPLATFAGNAFFAYTTTDNQGATSPPALYTIAVGVDNASVYTGTPLKGGANQYQNGDVVSNAFDANGGTYNAAAAVVDNGVRTASAGALPDGLELDPATGQVRVANRSLLVAGSYPVSITTIDVNGGTNTQVVTLVIGTAPLPVELTRFEATAAGTDARLSWSTAQELDNAGFQVERSLNGTTYEALGFVAGAGTSSQAHAYAFVDAGVGRQHSGAVYYRLQQRDGSGRATFSPVRTVAFAAGTPLAAQYVALYPNPAATTTTLDLTALTGPSQVTVLDMAGRVVMTRTMAGGQAHAFALGSLPDGTYVVLVRNNDRSFVERLLKH
ncbi:ESPR-type extended signal peptide-containing protein [Hymenobacter glaciei]|uniref:ESPR-type extended signal peptide-containing protein n=1 Tax=Hymenobacter glaciei TaxID=877209 RepID=A0ABP7U4F8_9BACT